MLSYSWESINWSDRAARSMKNSPLFTQVVQSLEKNENSNRIKKLIFYVAKRLWAQERTQLDNISLLALIEDLYASHSDLESLKKSFDRMARTLNKSEQYLSLAVTIIAELEILYKDFQNNAATGDTDLITTPLVNAFCQDALVDPDVDRPAKPIQTKQVDPFELRFKIAIQANPLQVKILLFSVLEHQFDWSQHDWAALRNTELYELIRNLNYTYQSVEVLASTLNSTARKLNKPDEYLAIANTIIQALKPMYA